MAFIAARRYKFLLAELCLVISLFTVITNAFQVSCSFISKRQISSKLVPQFDAQTRFLMTSDDSELFKNITEYTNDEQNKLLDEIRWRSKKISLEEENTKRFQKRLKSRPWKLPYEDARKWVQKNLGVDSKEEFFDLVANGNLRTPYIPKEPEKYYSEKGTWISWDHFLLEKAT